MYRLRRLHTALAARTQEPLFGQRAGSERGRAPPGVGYGVGATVAPGSVSNAPTPAASYYLCAGDLAADDAVQGQVNPSADASQDLGKEPDWVDAYDQVGVVTGPCNSCAPCNPQAREDPGAQPYTYPRASADGPLGVKDRWPGAPLGTKAAGAARVAAESIGDALRNAAEELTGGTSRGDRQQRPANTDMPGDYASIHVKGRTVMEEKDDA